MGFTKCPPSWIWRGIAWLFEEHPGEWAVLDRHRKHIGYLYNLKKRASNLEIATRKNADGTFGVWVKMNPIATEDKVLAPATELF